MITNNSYLLSASAAQALFSAQAGFVILRGYYRRYTSRKDWRMIPNIQYLIPTPRHPAQIIFGDQVLEKSDLALQLPGEQCLAGRRRQWVLFQVALQVRHPLPQVLSQRAEIIHLRDAPPQDAEGAEAVDVVRVADDVRLKRVRVLEI